MKIAFFSSHKFERNFISKTNDNKHELVFIEENLSEKSIPLALGCEAICIFVNDKTDALTLKKLHKIGIKYIALRSAGFNHVDLAEAKKLGIKVARVPEYSPFSVAEHAIALMLAMNRKLVHAHNRINELNFSLDGLVGFDMNGKTAGVIGTGKIGEKIAKILHGFGCKILAYDAEENESLKSNYGVDYVSLNTLFSKADIISLHLPLSSETQHIIDEKSIKLMKKGVMLINTSRGGLVNTVDVIQGIKSEKIGYFGMDVYEDEGGLFFEDHSETILQDDVFARLMSFQNVLITSHQAFLTETSLKNIADTTIYNIDCFENNTLSGNEL
ncbi:MAG: 2-hydroxyacid dehydrogenase [Flavobacterium sp.]|nr:2-hydroxyacid dehydrogenase [Flavobacterium sp.]